MRQDFKKINRLSGSERFRSVLKNGKIISAASAKIYFADNGINTPRLGIIVPAKAGNAVTRNKIKRQIREFFRKNKDRYSGLDIIVRINSVKNGWLAEFKGAMGKRFGER
ncbi:MAG: ribonuclease P protein component [Candidatus Aureabacteria bacterium]|nr:ribonuclease P protein component [Candidatus Auribacterota bacterium]